MLGSRSSLCWHPACSSSHKVDPTNILPNFLLHCDCGSGPGRALYVLGSYSYPEWSEEMSQKEADWSPSQRNQHKEFVSTVMKEICSPQNAVMSSVHFWWREPWQWASLHNMVSRILQPSPDNDKPIHSKLQLLMHIWLLAISKWYKGI